MSKSRQSYAGANNPNWRGGRTIPVKTICVICGEVFESPAQYVRLTCSPVCLAEYWLQHRSGENNPNWHGGKCKRLSGRDTRFKPRFIIEHEWLMEQYHTNHLSTPEIAELMGCSGSTIERWMRKYDIPFRSLSEGKKLKWKQPGCKARNFWGSNNPNWHGGKSFEPYPAIFNASFKRKIRQRDEYKCIICKRYGIYVHHIDYDKQNTIPENCITLCTSCHSVTNFNREYWEMILMELLKAHLDPDTVDASLRIG